MVAAIRDDYRSAPITDAEKVMIEYVIQLTEDAVKVRRLLREGTGT